jgi:hypothetical protein
MRSDSNQVKCRADIDGEFDENFNRASSLQVLPTNESGIAQKVGRIEHFPLR